MLKNILNEGMQKILRLTYKRLPKNKTIFLLGHDRSGSTWVGRTLAFNPNHIYLHEPITNHYFKTKEFLYHSYLPPKERSTTLEKIYDHASKGIMNRQKLNSRQTRGAITGKAPVIIKETGGMMIGEWLQQRYKTQIIALLRHPAAVISSVIKMGIDPDFWLKPLLENDHLRQDFFEGKPIQENYTNDPLSKMAAIYAIRYKALTQQLQRNPSWVVLRYEDLCKAPVEKFKELYERLGLNFSDVVQDKIQKSCSQDKSDEFFGIQRKTEKMDRRWKEFIDPQKEKTIREVLDNFNLTIYNQSQDWA